MSVDVVAAQPRWIVDPRVVLRALDGDGVVVLRGDDPSLLRGSVFKALLERLDGTRTSDQIVAELDSAHSAPAVYFALHQLEKRGLITAAAQHDELAERALWSDLGSTAHSSAAKSVQVFALPGIADDILTALLDGLPTDVSAHRIASATDLFSRERPDLLVVLAADYTDPLLEPINRACLAAGIHWLLVRPDARSAWIGPHFRPGVTACWECLMNRRRAQRRIHAMLAGGEESTVTVPILSTAQSAAMVGRMAAFEVTKILHGIPRAVGEGAPHDSASMTEVTLGDWSSRTHVVVRRPQCAVCGDPEPAPSAPVRPQAERVRRDDSGGLRTVSPEETYLRFRHHVSAITGAVAALAPLETPYEGTHVWYSGSNLGLPPEDLLRIDRTLRAMTAGKGTTMEQARTGALAEALERYSSSRHGEERVVRGSLEVFGDSALHPNDAMLYSDAQLDAGETAGSRPGWFNRVPARFDEQAEIEWTPVWSLTEDREILVPTAYCYYGTAGAREMGIAADSNGCAAGNTLTEAILQGFFELVERDGVAVWWYNRLRRPAVDLRSFEDPWIDAMIEEYRSKGRDVWAIDLTTDLDIPTFAAISRRTGDGPEALLMGFGAHLDPRVAILRALGEINQMSTTDDHLGDTDLTGSDVDLMEWIRTATVENQPYLVADPDVPEWRLEDHPSLLGADLAEDVDLCRHRVERAGLSMLVLDQTRPDIGLPVARVIVPGLRSFWSRYAPGRLYDVPVRLGWLDRANSSDELNPIPFFL